MNDIHRQLNHHHPDHRTQTATADSRPMNDIHRRLNHHHPDHRTQTATADSRPMNDIPAGWTATAGHGRITRTTSAGHFHER